MTHALDGPRLKLARADEHLSALDREFDVLFEPYTGKRSVHHTFDGTWHIITADPPLDEPSPPRLNVICGDAIHNIRCALDHLVWQLVLAEDNTPDRWTQFPIFVQRADFERLVVNPRDPKKNPLHGIDLNGGAWALIEQAQPYNRWKLDRDPVGHELAILAALSNIDKHRALMVQMLFPGQEAVRDLVGWNPDAILLEYKALFQPLTLENETEILKLRFSEAGPDPQVHVKGALAIEPTFGDEASQTPIGSIKNIRDYVGRLIDDSKQFF